MIYYANYAVFCPNMHKRYKTLIYGAFEVVIYENIAYNALTTHFYCAIISMVLFIYLYNVWRNYK